MCIEVFIRAGTVYARVVCIISTVCDAYFGHEAMNHEAMNKTMQTQNKIIFEAIPDSAYRCLGWPDPVLALPGASKIEKCDWMH